jgi:hypothetical protein
MAFKGIFKFKSKEYRLIFFQHEMTRVLDNRGAPASEPQTGYIHITIEVGEDNALAGWAFFGHQSEDGEIILYKRDSDAKLRSLKFKDGYVFRYLESFSADDSTPSTFSVSITAKEIELSPDGVDRIADWA